MFIKLRESTLFKLLSAAFCFNRESTASKATQQVWKMQGYRKWELRETDRFRMRSGIVANSHRRS